MNPGTPEYEAEFVTTRQRRPVVLVQSVGGVEVRLITFHEGLK